MQDGLGSRGTIESAKEGSSLDFVVLGRQVGETDVGVDGLGFVFRHGEERRERNESGKQKGNRVLKRKISERKFFPSSPESVRGLCAAHGIESRASQTEEKLRIQFTTQNFKF